MVSRKLKFYKSAFLINKNYKFSIFFLLVVACLGGPDLWADDTQYVYKYWDLGASQKRDEYQFLLLRLALEKTKPAFGSYELHKNNERYTSLRSTRELERGEIVNIIALPTPIWKTEAASEERSLTIRKPLLRGLLGYRKLLVRRADLPKFEKIKTQNELRQLVAGQGRDWEDLNVYKYNNFKVLDNADYYNLFAMLAAGRFDYIPLSVIEIDDMLARSSKYTDEFAVVPNLIIYYPFPVLYNLSVRHPELVGRLAKGLDMAEADGSLKQLFEKYFSEDVKKLRSGKLKIAVLKIPGSTSLGLDTPVLLKDPVFGLEFLP